MRAVAKRSCPSVRKEISPDCEAVRVPLRLSRAARRFKLTRRELETLSALVSGEPWKGDAVVLGISFHTVHFHVRNICRKTGAENPFRAFAKILNF